MVMADSFNTDQFKQSLLRVFRKDTNSQMKMAFGGTLKIKTSKQLKVQSCIGACSEGKSEWKMNSLDENSTYAFYFQVQNEQATQIPEGGIGYIQFITHYQYPSGETRVRVTTIGRHWVDAQMNHSHIATGFDQEAAIVLMARKVIVFAETYAEETTMEWLDKSLTRFCQKFANYQKNDPSSFALAEQFSMFPQFIFYFKRSLLLNLANNSPDQTAYCRHCLLEADLFQSLVMLQPVL